MLLLLLLALPVEQASTSVFPLAREGSTVCSSVAIATHHLLTASHCLANHVVGDDAGVTVKRGEQLYTTIVVRVWGDWDLAILSAPGLTMIPMPVAKAKPSILDELVAIGYAYGFDHHIYTFHRYEGDITRPDHVTKFTLYGPAAPAMSGAPVVNGSGQLVSILQETDFNILTWGARYEQVLLTILSR